MVNSYASALQTVVNEPTYGNSYFILQIQVCIYGWAISQLKPYFTQPVSRTGERCASPIQNVRLCEGNALGECHYWKGRVEVMCILPILMLSIIIRFTRITMPTGFDFCRFCVVIRFFHPCHNGQWPPTSKDFIHYIYFLILILEKESVFPF